MICFLILFSFPPLLLLCKKNKLYFFAFILILQIHFLLSSHDLPPTYIYPEKNSDYPEKVRHYIKIISLFNLLVIPLADCSSLSIITIIKPDEFPIVISLIFISREKILIKDCAYLEAIFCVRVPISVIFLIVIMRVVY